MKKLKIRKLDLKDPQQREEFKHTLVEVRKTTQPMGDAIRDSQRITASDLAITINVKA